MNVSTNAGIRRLAYVSPLFPGLRHGFEANELVALSEHIEVIVLSLRAHRSDEWLWWATGFGAAATRVRVVTLTKPKLLWTAARTVLRHPWHSAAVALEALGLLARDLRGALKTFAASVAGLAVADQVARLQCDWIHADFASAPATAAMAASRVTGVPFSFCGHAVDVFSTVPAGRATRYLLARKLSRAAAVFAANRKCVEVFEEVCEEFGVRASPTIKRNGVLCLPSVVTPSPTKPCIVGLGALVPKKGFDTLVLACAQVRRSWPHTHLRIHGEGPEREKLQRLSRLVSAPVALPGAYKYADLRSILEEASVVVVPSRELPSGDSDGVPTVFIEALAYGTPVIGTPVGSVTDLITDGETGWLVAPDDPDALARAICEVLQNPGEARRRALVGRRRVAESFLVSGAVRAMLDVLAEVRDRREALTGCESVR